MHALTLLRWGVAVIAVAAAGLAAATTVEVSFSEYSGGEMNSGFPAAAAIVGQKPEVAVPPGEAIVSGTISGSWGNLLGDCCHGTAGVDVYLDGLLVVQCLQSDVSCYCPDSAPCVGPVPWSLALTPAQVAALNAGDATLTAVQTSPRIIRLGATKLTLTTAPIVPPVTIAPVVPQVPTLSLPGLVLMLLGIATIGLVAVRRRQTARR